MTRLTTISKPTAGQLLWTALILACFFGVAAVLAYEFVSWEVRKATLSDLQDHARQLNNAIAFDKGVNLERYNRAFVDAGDYFVVLADGSIIDIASGSKGMLRGVLPSVQPVFRIEDALREPLAVSHSVGGEAEHWTVLAKKLEGGVAILGVSAFDAIPAAPDVLRRNIERIGHRLSDAVHLNPGVFANSLHWAVISDAGELVTAFGRLPLRTDPMEIGKQSARNPEVTIEGKPYIVLYAPLLDKSRQPVGTIILPQSLERDKEVLRNEFFFSASVAAISFVVFLILAARNYSKHGKEVRTLREAFQKFVSPKVMDQLLNDPAQAFLGGRRREVTILFSDIRSFTTLSESLPPQQLIQLLQEYFQAMTEEVMSEEGFLDKYIGDGIMAFWGAPVDQQDQADRAVRTAQAMIRRLQNLQEQWRAAGFPIIDIGIGINLGVATVGNMGSSERFDYTAIGDTVNAASRLEQLTKEYANHIIISESTKQQLTIQAKLKDLGEVKVKGKEKSIRVYEVLPN